MNISKIGSLSFGNYKQEYGNFRPDDFRVSGGNIDYKLSVIYDKLLKIEDNQRVILKNQKTLSENQAKVQESTFDGFKMFASNFSFDTWNDYCHSAMLGNKVNVIA